METVTQPGAGAQRKVPGPGTKGPTPVFSAYVLPFLQWFSLMIIIAILFDLGLHYLKLVAIGRYLGYAGTFTIIGSFGYSLRKRKIINTGSPKTYLAVHEYMAWAGSVMLLVHAGIHFNALLPWLAVLAMIISVISGLVGKFLLKKASLAHKENIQALVMEGATKEEAEKQLFFESITVDLMKKWRIVHLPITLLFALLALIHIITVYLFMQ
ncbi:MAG TPA: hypothetical protein VJ499_16690 [Flavisolibacter sp.]|nr:hypothetical protein [Flavisolibacter sp.]